MSNKKPIRYYVINPNPGIGKAYFIADSTTDIRFAHKRARELTKSEGVKHLVCKPVAEYSVEIKKRRIN